MTTMERKWTERHRLQALGRESADLLLKNCKLVNVLSGEIEDGIDIAIGGDRIVGVGHGYEAAHVIDCTGLYVHPGLIDAHIHLESTKMTVFHAAKRMSQSGTTAVITDPHEITNVAGLAGFMFQSECARLNRYIDVYFTAPSCVPTLNDLSVETPGAKLDSETLALLANMPSVVGLGEMMNVPGVLDGDAEVIEKIDRFLSVGKVVDGHAPGLSGHALNAYIASGISSDHESTVLEEAREKLRRGMYVMIREGTSEHNLEALLPLIDKNGRNISRLMFVSDDLDPRDMEGGHINRLLRRAVAAGVDPIMAIQMATSSPARYFGLDREIGAIAPGMLANIVVCQDLIDFNVHTVVFHGRVSSSRHLQQKENDLRLPYLPTTMNIALPALEDLRVPYCKGMQLRTIDLVEGQIVTRAGIVDPCVVGGYVEASPADDVAKICVFDRHRASGSVGIGFVRGFGLKRGAFGSTVAHDSHNLIVVGTDDESILTCADRIIAMGGGQAAIDGDSFVDMPLPIAGLMSDMDDVVETETTMAEFCKTALELKLKDPFAALSFLALPVIPEIRITDRGLFRIHPDGGPECVDILV